MLEGKTVLLGVTGSIAAYKAAALASALKKERCNVRVLMTRNAMEFVAPRTFETLTEHRVLFDTFDRNFEYNVEHIALAKQADLVIIAPATANVLAKLANGIADDMLTTTVLACRCPKLAAPAMNTGMYENPVTQANLERLRAFGWEVVAPAEGLLACGDVGAGKMPEPRQLLEHVKARLEQKPPRRDMEHLRVLVTAGPTREAIDPVRYITNRSTGKMGYSIAEAAAKRGAVVTLVTGQTNLTTSPFLERVNVVSAREMFDAVTRRSAQQDIIIKAAAVADYRPAEVANDKLKKKDGEMILSLVRNPDILQYLGEHRPEGQYLCGFSMETRDMVENSQKKLRKKKIQMIAANNLKESGAGFGVDTNVLTLITKEDVKELPLLTKEAAADILLDEILRHRAEIAE
ncbi:MAG: bifunctional phosphopantothenoylcysteine decarboxylase/phosphopantothenate--cysteine ligase CoaBC [Oscillospiraceae bacterium]|jgi:phosphopantothenoylcysteine decarboxylase/phosphopantothenate--cysteine ligase